MSDGAADMPPLPDADLPPLASLVSPLPLVGADLPPLASLASPLPDLPPLILTPLEDGEPIGP